ncbi:MAG: GNAT family N-acetyltransferase [Chloroflexi bacterium]|nr:GNAT family N-acetyltransferase [Chloroflexota bacterium]
MSNLEKQGVVGTTALSAEQRAAVETLLAECNQFEQIKLILDLEPANFGPEATPENVDQFLAYDQGKIVGFARLDGWSQPELCGVVAPDQRRKGVGRSLLASVRDECRRRGVEQMLLVCDEAGASGKAFAAAVGADLNYAEYRMQLDPTAIDRSRPRFPTLRLQPATADDIELVAHIQATAFGDPEDEVRPYVIKRFHQPERQYLIGLLDDQPVGILRLGRYQHEADITAFGVLPEYQGRGYGRQMLLDAIDLLLAENWAQIMIDVVIENRNALRLYQSCGFREVTTYSFYNLGA